MIKGLGPHPSKWCSPSHFEVLRHKPWSHPYISILSHPIVNLLENPKTQTLLRPSHSSVPNVPMAPMLHTKPESLHWSPALYDLAALSLMSLLIHSAPATLATVLFLTCQASFCLGSFALIVSSNRARVLHTHSPSFRALIQCYCNWHTVLY